MSDWNAQIIEEFRANDGKVGGFFEEAPLLLLHNIGARSGRRRVVPLVYQAVDGGYAVFASKAGAPTNPDWFHNLMANPAAEVEIGPNTIPVTARRASERERERIWTRQKEVFPHFGENKTDRIIPVVVLEPRWPLSTEEEHQPQHDGAYQEEQRQLQEPAQNRPHDRPHQDDGDDGEDGVGEGHERGHPFSCGWGPARVAPVGAAATRPTSAISRRS